MPQGTEVSVDHGAAAGVDPAALERWRVLRAARDLQFSPSAPWHPRPDPPWVGALGRWLEGVFQPLARLLGGGWFWIERGLIALAVVGALWLLWVLLSPLMRRRRAVVAAGDETPAEVAALLRDAEALAADGDFATAIHLVLQRCVAQVAAAWPGSIHAASTAREIAAMAALPEAARGALGAIVGRVEASRYALRAPGEADWLVARDAYAAFARVGLA